MGYANWLKLGKPKSITPVGTSPKPTISAKGQIIKPPAWLAEKWNRYSNAGINVTTGVAAGSMIPLAADKGTDSDVLSIGAKIGAREER